jgi:hypothetical protein
MAKGFAMTVSLAGVEGNLILNAFEGFLVCFCREECLQKSPERR